MSTLYVRCTSRSSHGIIAAAVAATLIGLAGYAPSARAAARAPVTIQLLNVSDWHGQLDPLSVVGVGDVGGAAVISTYWNADRAAYPSLTLTAGDAVGATPPISNFFGDVPAILAMNLMGFDADSFGNHNFDAGLEHLQGLIDLAEFPYLSANLANLEGNLDGVMPYQLFDVGGVIVGVVGATNFDAPTLVRPGSLGPIEVTDPVPAANKARAAAQAAGAKVTVAIVHMGVTGFDSAGNPTGPLVDFANDVGGFDVILGDHTDVQWSGVINGHVVLENRSKGLTYARTLLTVDPENGRVIDTAVQFVTPRASLVTPDPAIVALLQPYRVQLSQIFDGVIGVATGLFVRGGNIERRQEVPIGNLVADAIRIHYGTEFSFTNGGGIRAPLPSSYLPVDHTLRRTSPTYAPGPPYDLVVGDVFATLPFGNEVVTTTITGALLWSVLENAVSQISATGTGVDGRFAQISGFKFTYSSSVPAGSRVRSVTFPDGTPIPADGTVYTLATNDFVSEGGDGYGMLVGNGGTSREIMFDVVLDYIRSLSTVTPTTDGRITRVP